MEGRSRTLAPNWCCQLNIPPTPRSTSPLPPCTVIIEMETYNQRLQGCPHPVGQLAPLPNSQPSPCWSEVTLTCSSYYCCLTTYCWNSALNSKQQCHLLAQCYGWGIWAGISWEVLYSMRHGWRSGDNTQMDTGWVQGVQVSFSHIWHLTGLAGRRDRSQTAYTWPSAGWSQGVRPLT